MDDEFNDYLNKFNEEMNDKYINPDADRSFLDKKEKPTDLEIVRLFITDDDKVHAVDLTNYNIKELGNPDKVKTIEGTEWILSKLLWYREEGRIITFDIIQLKASIDDIKNTNDVIFEDITFEDVTTNPESYQDLINEAIEDEDFPEAARLRDWLKKFKTLGDKLLPLMQKAIHDEDLKLYDKYARQLNDHTDTL